MDREELDTVPPICVIIFLPIPWKWGTTQSGFAPPLIIQTYRDTHGFTTFVKLNGGVGLYGHPVLKHKVC